MTGPELTGLRAVVTGASRGIGETIAKAFAAHGAHTVLVSRNADELRRVAGEITTAGGRVEVCPCDLGIRADVTALGAGLGEVDVLVNNAMAGDKFVPVVQRDDAHWQTTWEIGLYAPMLLIQAVAPGMASRGRGSIINVSSTNGIEPTPMMGAYCVTKAALEQLTRVTALELGASGVRCNALAPGIVLTEMAANLIGGPVWDYMQSLIPAGRAAALDEVADLAVFLAGDRSRYLNGQVVHLDGGATTGNFGVMHAMRAALAPANGQPARVEDR